MEVAEFKLEQYGYQKPPEATKSDFVIEHVDKVEKKFNYKERDLTLVEKKSAPQTDSNNSNSMEHPEPPVLSVPLVRFWNQFVNLSQIRKETPPPSRVKLAVKTPTLEDFGISASSLQMIAEKQQKDKPKPVQIFPIVEDQSIDLPEEPKFIPESPLNIQKALNFSPPCTPIITPAMFPLGMIFLKISLFSYRCNN